MIGSRRGAAQKFDARVAQRADGAEWRVKADRGDGSAINEPSSRISVCFAYFAAYSYSAVYFAAYIAYFGKICGVGVSAVAAAREDVLWPEIPQPKARKLANINGQYLADLQQRRRVLLRRLVRPTGAARAVSARRCAHRGVGCRPIDGAPVERAAAAISLSICIGGVQ